MTTDSFLEDSSDLTSSSRLILFNKTGRISWYLRYDEVSAVFSGEKKSITIPRSTSSLVSYVCKMHALRFDSVLYDNYLKLCRKIGSQSILRSISNADGGATGRRTDRVLYWLDDNNFLHICPCRRDISAERIIRCFLRFIPHDKRLKAIKNLIGCAGRPLNLSTMLFWAIDGIPSIALELSMPPKKYIFQQDVKGSAGAIQESYAKRYHLYQSALFIHITDENATWGQ